MATLTPVRALARQAPLLARDLTAIVLLLALPDRFRETGVRSLDPELLAAARRGAGAATDVPQPRAAAGA